MKISNQLKITFYLIFCHCGPKICEISGNFPLKAVNPRKITTMKKLCFSMWAVSSTQGRVGLRLGFSENFRFRLGLGFCRTGLGWVSVFIFQKTRFSVGFWVFSKFKKKMEIFRQNCDERRKKSKKIIHNLKLTKPWFHQKSLMVNPYITKSFGY